MTTSSSRAELFDGSRDMISVSASINEKAAAFPIEVVVTARPTGVSVWSTTVVIPPFSLTRPRRNSRTGGLR